MADFFPHFTHFRFYISITFKITSYMILHIYKYMYYRESTGMHTHACIVIGIGNVCGLNVCLMRTLRTSPALNRWDIKTINTVSCFLQYIVQIKTIYSFCSHHPTRYGYHACSQGISLNRIENTYILHLFYWNVKYTDPRNHLASEFRYFGSTYFESKTTIIL